MKARVSLPKELRLKRFEESYTPQMSIQLTLRLIENGNYSLPKSYSLNFM